MELRTISNVLRRNGSKGQTARAILPPGLAAIRSFLSNRISLPCLPLWVAQPTRSLYNRAALSMLPAPIVNRQAEPEEHQRKMVRPNMTFVPGFVRSTAAPSLLPTHLKNASSRRNTILGRICSNVPAVKPFYRVFVLTLYLALISIAFRPHVPVVLPENEAVTLATGVEVPVTVHDVVDSLTNIEPETATTDGETARSSAIDAELPENTLASPKRKPTIDLRWPKVHGLNILSHLTSSVRNTEPTQHKGKFFSPVLNVLNKVSQSAPEIALRFPFSGTISPFIEIDSAKARPVQEKEEDVAPLQATLIPFLSPRVGKTETIDLLNL